MSDELQMHEIESIVTPDRTEFGVARMRVPGGWIYWLQPAGAGSLVSSFVPNPPDGAADAPARLLGAT